eukprot:522820_1
MVPISNTGKPVQLLTLVFPRRGNDELLLGRKKRGFGKGRLNGFGGKVEAGENIASAAARELEEESKLVVTEEHLLKRGQLEFTLSTYPYDMRVSVYECTEFGGREEETAEMAPQWFRIDDGKLPPFEEMWPDDRYWFRSLLDERKPYFEGCFHFSDEDTITEYVLKENGTEVLVEPFPCHQN